MTIQDIDRQLAEKYAYQKLINANIPFTGGQSSAAKEAINANYAKSNAISTKRNNEEIEALLILRDNFLNPEIINESNLDPESNVIEILPQSKLNEIITPITKMGFTPLMLIGGGLLVAYVLFVRKKK